MIKRYLMVAALAAALAGCGSSVKLDPPIQGADATATGQGAGQAGVGQGAGQSTVTQVQAGSGGVDAAGPAGVGRVIYFDFDSFTVKPEYQPLVDQHARFLQGNRSRSVAVEGNTDERGSREYNLALGQKRAEAVRRALTLVGASDAQVEAVSFGEEKPAVAGSSEDAYAKNRRVEIRYR
ncbi:peptidoglycan-associated lipoprotein Pal [Ottowia sp.]|uniref:peptidoglycan-associated lipoprotein Pal n=1 Tax=Ottowia sp. TaxID=1898956 RepID=UPI002BAB134D|nr:peptidoglycan-associated lipoprotein Pal [Ottowia sp.]HOB65857.1 peptidoglycan-associated lipoprotein Pal [Ottowia sp.]HPZ58819.1 peptidoglycan-associated lipoprotein Pal [Ottowia sp.]HQD46779.1 peptidoglycan-associated lipoprotein Pal [Ottowia sp.]